MVKALIPIALDEAIIGGLRRCVPRAVSGGHDEAKWHLLTNRLSDVSHLATSFEELHFRD